MTRPDPILPQAVPEGTSLPAAPEAGVLSSVPTVRAIQESAFAGVNKHVQLQEAVRQVREMGGTAFVLKSHLHRLVGLVPGLVHPDESAVFMGKLSQTQRNLDFLRIDGAEEYDKAA